jgi:glutathione S-transferase
MALVVHGHPFSSYCQKVTIAFHEVGLAYEWRKIEDAAGFSELKRLWPVGLMPVVAGNDQTVVESSIIIECFAPKLVTSLDVRFLDRFFDLYVMTPMQKVVSDALRAEGERDPRGVADAKARLEVSYEWLDGRLGVQGWATDEGFTLADCAAAPSLFYADWVHPIAEKFPNTRAYRERLLAHPSVKRAVEEARPYRKFFPLGAPDRD